MKGLIRTGILFAGILAALVLIVCAGLGLDLQALIRQRLLLGVVCGFGFLLTVLLVLLWRYLELPEVVQQKGQHWLLSFLFPAASLVMLLVVSSISETALSVLVVAGVLVIANASVFALLRSMRQERERVLLRQQMEIQTGSILALEKSYRAQRKAAHEYHSQLQTIHDLLLQHQEEAALGYVRQLQGMQTTRIFAVNTHHPILDAVLNQKYQAAQEAGIAAQFQVNDLSGLSLDTDALVVLFSNLLDNAIEGCLRCEGERSIHCTILLEDGLFLSIRNTAPPVTITDGHIPTSKPDPKNHGFGLPGVRRILDDAGAEYTYRWQDGWFQFVAEIPCN